MIRVSRYFCYDISDWKNKIQAFCLISTKNIDLKKFLREAVFYIVRESLYHFHFIFKNTEMKNVYISWLTLVLNLSFTSRVELMIFSKRDK